MQTRLSLAGIRDARARIAPAFLDSPQVELPSLSDRLGARIQVKIEILNPVRCFKGRGVETFISRIGETAPDCRHLVCASAGNLGQALAYSGARQGLKVTIVAATTASPLKLQRMRQLGAEVVLLGHDFDAAKVAAEGLAETLGARLLVDSLEVATCEGAGTIALEILEQDHLPEVLFVPLGNGALVTGIAQACKALRPQMRIVAVQAAAAPAMAQSWRARRAVPTATAATIADGLAVRTPIPEVLEDLLALVDEVVLVDEAQIAAGMDLLLHQTGLMCEPSAAVGIAAMLADPGAWRGRSLATVLCGGNIAPDDFNRLTRPGA